jgi:hypothetical protein
MQEIIDSIDQDWNNFFENVKIGDFVDSNEDAFYLSGHQYKTKNKLYEVKQIDVRRDEHGKIYCRSVIVEGDYQNHKTKRNLVWLSPTRVIYRDGKLVWESNLQKSSKLCIELHSHELTQEEIDKLKIYIYTTI